VIAFLRGIIVATQGETAIIEINGIGFLLQVSAWTANRLPPPGTEVKLYTHLISREDGSFLYGFYDQSELELFRFLISVGGVGPKAAMGLLSTLNPETLQAAVTGGNVEMLKRAPGIGRKTAERIVLELKDRLGKSTLLKKTAPVEISITEENDAVAALIALGYGEAEARKAVQQAPTPADITNTAADMVRAALKQLSAANPGLAARNQEAL